MAGEPWQAMKIDIATLTDAELLAYFGTPDRPRPLEESDIRWDSEPEYQLERLDLLGLTPDEIVYVAFLLQSALRDMRQLVHVAVAELATAHRQLRIARAACRR
jgi:hypothetical protein